MLSYNKQEESSPIELELSIEDVINQEIIDGFFDGDSVEASNYYLIKK